MFVCSSRQCHLSASFLSQIIIDRGNNTPVTTIECAESLDECWEYSLKEAMVDLSRETLPLLKPDRYSSTNFGLVVNCSRAKSDVDSVGVKHQKLLVTFHFKVSDSCNVFTT